MFIRTLASAVTVGVIMSAVAEAAPYRYHRRWRGPRFGPAWSSFHFAAGPGFYPSFGVGFGHYPVSFGFSYIGGPRDPRGALRLHVEPKHAEVFIDGYYAGIVDDFDGTFQKLRLEPGPHDVTLYLDGHRVFEETVYSSLGTTVRIRHDMEPLAPGEPVPSRPPVPGVGPRAPAPSAPPTSPPAISSPPSVPAPPAASATEFGVLALRTQPRDAALWVNGEAWDLPEEDERLLLHLPAGHYEIQLARPGYDTFTTQVDIFPGETTALNVHLGVR